MECFVIIVNGFQQLTIITKRSIITKRPILDVAAALDPRLHWFTRVLCEPMKSGSRLGPARHYTCDHNIL